MLPPSLRHCLQAARWLMPHSLFANYVPSSTSMVFLSSRAKHILHCCLFLFVLLAFEIVCGGVRLWEFDFQRVDPIREYGYIGSAILYLLRFVMVLALPQCIANCIGLLMYNAFPDKIQLKGSPLLAPFICIRTVTRGDFPELVRTNVLRNMNTCLDVGLENFMMEVVTDKALNTLPKHARIREVVVPSTYRTKSGSLFKARALQYCLEDDVNILSDQDWIVHLDEETLLTDNAVRGILNFVLDSKCQFGQGLITYANETVVNWVTTLADSFRVADDMGKLRFQLRVFGKPLFGWKGSYVVTQAGAERKVSFDHGLDGSVAEDCFFGMIAYKEGYYFNFIEGEMWEKSPFTFWDFLQQRKRWMQGIFLVVHSPCIPLKNKLYLAISLYSWLTIPLSTSNLILAAVYPIPCWQIFDILCCFVGAVNMYMYIFGVVKSFSLYRFGVIRFILCVFGAVATIPFNVVIENIAVIWGCFGNKYRFYVVNKEVRPPILV